MAITRNNFPLLWDIAFNTNQQISKGPSVCHCGRAQAQYSDTPAGKIMQAAITDNHAGRSEMKRPSLTSSFVPVHSAQDSPSKESWQEALPRRSSMNVQQNQQSYHHMMPSLTQALSTPAYTVPRTIRPIYHSSGTSPPRTFSISSLNSSLNLDSSLLTPPRTMSGSPLHHEFYDKLTDSLSPSANVRRLVTAPFIPQPLQAMAPLRRMTLTPSDLPSYRKIQPERGNPRARKRSANISELKFSHFYHPTEKPFCKIRVWKNDRNLLFYDCDCGRRKAVQDLKKILSHVSKNCRLCDTDDQAGSGTNSPFESPFDLKEVGMKATAADIAAAAAILTMSNANASANDRQSTLTRDVESPVAKSHDDHINIGL